MANESRNSRTQSEPQLALNNYEIFLNGIIMERIYRKLFNIIQHKAFPYCCCNVIRMYSADGPNDIYPNPKTKPTATAEKSNILSY